MNKLLSVAVIIMLPAGGLFSSPVLYVFLFYLFLKIFSCSEQSAVGLLVRVAGQSLGIAAVCALLKFQPKPVGKKHPHMSVSPLPLRSPGNRGAPVGGGSWPQKSPHPV